MAFALGAAGCGGGEQRYEVGEVLEVFADAGVPLQTQPISGDTGSGMKILEPEAKTQKSSELGVFSVLIYPENEEPIFIDYRNEGERLYVLDTTDDSAVAKQYGENVQLEWRACCEGGESTPDDPQFERLDRILSSLGDEQ